MLKSLRFKNYRCFDDHEADFSRITVAVGRNNAGKTTLIEALRLVAIATSKFKKGVFSSAPEWTGLGLASKGFRLSLGKIEFSFDGIIYQFGEPPAIITATFDNNTEVSIFINAESEIFCCVTDSTGVQIEKSYRGKGTELAEIHILPQITPLLPSENVLDVDYVRANTSSHLSSRHFRNQMSYLHEYFPRFKKMAEDSWPDLRIVDLTKAQHGFEKVSPSLTVQAEGYSTEIGNMGHGLQMWLQMIWFLARTPSTSIVILDEPDVYLHADLQRKLIRMLRGNFHQVITATHSLEIMAEVDYDSILVVDRRNPKSYIASDFPSIQSIIYNDIGSIHNLQLARMWSSRKLLLVEGDDLPYLKKFQDKLFPTSKEPLDSIPNMEIEGWGGWNYVKGSKMILSNAAGEAISVFCLFDSDYHLQPEIEKRYDQAKKDKIHLHIWNKKEIENYFLIPSAIYRAIIKNKPSLSSLISEKDIEDELNNIANKLKEDTIDNFASEIGKYYRRDNKIIDHFSGKEMSYEVKRMNQLARKIVENRWHEPLAVVSGKQVLKMLNTWFSENHATNTNVLEIGAELRPEEIDDEIRIVLEAVEFSKPINIT